MDGTKLSNQDKIRMLGEKKTDQYLGILEADNIKREGMKEKNQERIFQKNQKVTKRQNHIAETLSME